MVRCNLCGSQKNPLEIIHPPVPAQEIIGVVEAEDGEYAVFKTPSGSYRSWRICSNCLEEIRRRWGGLIILPFKIKEEVKGREKRRCDNSLPTTGGVDICTCVSTDSRL